MFLYLSWGVINTLCVQGSVGSHRFNRTTETVGGTRSPSEMRNVISKARIESNEELLRFPTALG